MLDGVVPLVFGSILVRKILWEINVATSAERPPGQVVQEIMNPGIYSENLETVGTRPTKICHKIAGCIRYWF